MTARQSRSPEGPSSPWRMTEGSSLPLVGRLLTFGALVLAVYWAFRQVTVLLFAPELAVVGPVLPPRALSPSATVDLGVLVVNRKLTPGAAFVVAALGDGRQIEGPTVGLPPHDTTLVPVSVPLAGEDRTISLVVFDSWRGLRRLQTFSGLRIAVTESQVAVEHLDVPDSIRGGTGFSFKLLARNHDTEPVTIRPRLNIQSGPFQEDRWISGDPTEIGAGGSALVSIAVEGGLLAPGTHFVHAVLETEEGIRVGGARYPVPLVVSP